MGLQQLSDLTSLFDHLRFIPLRTAAQRRFSAAQPPAQLRS